MSTFARTIGGAQKVPGKTLPEYKEAGSNLTVASYSFDAGTEEAIQYPIPSAPAYTSGNATVKIFVYADTATTGNMIFGVRFAAITPGDATNTETKSWGAQTLSSATAASGTAHGLVTVTVTVASGDLDSLATGDLAFIEIARLGANGSDTMSGDAQVVGFEVTYS